MTSNLDAAHDLPVQWRDRKRHMWLYGMIPPTAIFIATALVYAMNQLGWQQFSPFFFWIGPLLVYVILPLLDLRFGADGENAPDEVMEALENDKYYRYCTYIFIPFQYASFFLGAYYFTATDLSWIGFDNGISWISKLGIALSIGVLGGVGINTAHEMGHKKDELERWLSKITLAQTFYGHFYIEHNRGHHVRVATPEDPASSRFGETFWGFWPRSVWGSLKSSWNLEATRMKRLNRFVLHPSNDVVNAWLMTVVLFGVTIAIFGTAVIPYLIIQAIYGFTFLETVNYLEHYGLLRQKVAGGRYERCTPKHSWNSDHLVTNIFLYHLQRHSDHHANPTRRYQTLRSMDGAPNLPSGYATMLTLAYFPPLWRKVMDQRVLDHYDGDITKVNIQPSKRAKILAKYGVTEQAA
ncbi:MULTISPECIES: alkane 1-monooxygenase [Mycobacteroides]|jgi:alkane 1-monooxygenase|uniref:Alkane 1-monooxygenase n=1 Tax=Mycobacteroides chelonae TaxID=1774 RepID=A0A1S1MBP7_MYCCH|nr:MULTISPECIES: alkane 1-monooxygenase [Mycobacteroides]AMW21122.1 alkane 1-monooxygenase [Mycobacterium sp. QIA-37]AYM44861.1 alkane 1-monooxygenase [[Mycobacterium] chelonae subsp. gwanakae]KRQ18265.1 alkane 1-monooxygenase [Mycobacteroides sp. H003]KRQ25700.1 alkane 1-monooxygenase [Mycobacteroides sp. H092]KRQ33605.1 alkane 1-monooxygenase [Mycobacteroides sp. H101]